MDFFPHQNGFYFRNHFRGNLKKENLGIIQLRVDRIPG